MIKILWRDINGKKFEFFGKEYEICKIEKYIKEDDEILMVYYNQQVIWCSLGNTIGITTEDIIGFFA